MLYLSDSKMNVLGAVFAVIFTQCCFPLVISRIVVWPGGLLVAKLH